MTFSELLKSMREFNNKYNIAHASSIIDGVEMVAEVIFKDEALNPTYAPYSKASRTYRFDNYNKALTTDDLGYSIFAYCKTDNDTMRIERYTNKDFESCRIISVRERNNFKDRFFKDMALSKSDAIDKCISLGKQFIKHFDKVYNNSNSRDVEHWLGEMIGWLKTVKSYKLKSTNDYLTDTQLFDWFFTAGANAEDFMRNPTLEESKDYSKFITKVLSTGTIKKTYIKDTF